MIRYLAPALAVFLLLGADNSKTHAQIAFRAGGGLYIEDKEPGWHGSIILPFGSKPAGVMLAAEYYDRDGVITVPLSIRGLYKIPLGDKFRIYGGAGSGLIYTKEESDTELIDLSSTKVLFTAVAGSVSLFYRSHPGPGRGRRHGKQIRREGRHLSHDHRLRKRIHTGNHTMDTVKAVRRMPVKRISPSLYCQINSRLGVNGVAPSNHIVFP